MRATLSEFSSVLSGSFRIKLLLVWLTVFWGVIPCALLMSWDAKLGILVLCAGFLPLEYLICKGLMAKYVRKVIIDVPARATFGDLRGTPTILHGPFVPKTQIVVLTSAYGIHKERVGASAAFKRDFGPDFSANSLPTPPWSFVFPEN
jgi:hypothetical protein